MSIVNIKFKIDSDKEGFLTFECPFCESEFKLRADEIQNDKEPILKLYCPYCGLNHDKDHFYTKEVVEHVKNLAMNYMIEELNKTFSKLSKDLNKNKFIKMTHKPLKKVNVKDVTENETSEEIFKCKLCNNHMKVLYCIGISKIFCSYCGVDI